MALLTTDPIADLLTRIRNAALVQKSRVVVPHSRMKETIARELQRAGYLSRIDVEGEGVKKDIIITINGASENARFTAIDRVSKPGRRVYAAADEIPRVRNGRGIVLISTSKGVMTGTEAKKQHLGGELICKIY
jgi:small subunit ribosomal protein S8